jgi:S1-C subfamily serine protease
MIREAVLMHARLIMSLSIVIFIAGTTATLGQNSFNWEKYTQSSAQDYGYFEKQLQAAQNYNSMTNVPYLTSLIMPEVVAIFAYDKNGHSEHGSGFFTSSKHIITCAHVIDSADLDYIKIFRYMPLGLYGPWGYLGKTVIPPQIYAPVPSEYNATIVFKSNYSDLALLAIDSPIGIGLPINCSYPMQGEDVLVFGSPINTFFTVSKGIVSGFRYPWERGLLEAPEITNELLPEYMNETRGLHENNSFYIQFEAPVSEGSSGGPLVNAKGEVIGIVVLGILPNSSENINYAIPSCYLCSDQSSRSPTSSQ